MRLPALCIALLCALLAVASLFGQPVNARRLIARADEAASSATATAASATTTAAAAAAAAASSQDVKVAVPTTTTTAPQETAATTSPTPTTTEPATPTTTTTADPTTTTDDDSETTTEDDSSPTTTADSSTPTSSASHSSSGSSHKTAIIIGAAAGGAVLIAIIGIILFRKMSVSPSNEFKNRIKNDPFYGGSAGRHGGPVPLAAGAGGAGAVMQNVGENRRGSADKQGRKGASPNRTNTQQVSAAAAAYARNQPTANSLNRSLNPQYAFDDVTKDSYSSDPSSIQWPAPAVTAAGITTTTQDPALMYAAQGAQGGYPAYGMVPDPMYSFQDYYQAYPQQQAGVPPSSMAAAAAPQQPQTTFNEYEAYPVHNPPDYVSNGGYVEYEQNHFTKQ